MKVSTTKLILTLKSIWPFLAIPIFSFLMQKLWASQYFLIDKDSFQFLLPSKQGFENSMGVWGDSFFISFYNRINFANLIKFLNLDLDQIIYLNFLILFLSALILFKLFFKLHPNKLNSLFFTSLFLLNPTNLFLARTINSDILGNFFIIVFLYFLFTEGKKTKFIFLALLIATIFRIENLIFLIPTTLYLKSLKKVYFYFLSSLFFINIVNLWPFWTQNWIWEQTNIIFFLRKEILTAILAFTVIGFLVFKFRQSFYKFLSILLLVNYVFLFSNNVYQIEQFLDFLSFNFFTLMILLVFLGKSIYNMHWKKFTADKRSKFLALNILLFLAFFQGFYFQHQGVIYILLSILALQFTQIYFNKQKIFSKKIYFLTIFTLLISVFINLLIYEKEFGNFKIDIQSQVSQSVWEISKQNAFELEQITIVSPFPEAMRYYLYPISSRENWYSDFSKNQKIVLVDIYNTGIENLVVNVKGIYKFYFQNNYTFYAEWKEKPLDNFYTIWLLEIP